MKEQWEIYEFVAQAEAKRQRGEPLTEREWMHIQFAFPPRCHSCGTHHNLGGEAEDE